MATIDKDTAFTASTWWTDLLAQDKKIPRTAEQLHDFQWALIAELMDIHTPYHFGVDYNPSPILFRAAKTANIDNLWKSLPIKTHMVIDYGVDVICGYAAPRKQIRTRYMFPNFI